MSGNVLWSYFVRGRQCPITSRRMCFCIINLAFVKYFGHNFNCSQMAIWPVWTCWLKNFQLFCCPPILKLPTSCPLRQYLCGSFYETFLSFLSFYKTGIYAAFVRWTLSVTLSFAPLGVRRNSTVPLYFHIWHGFSITLQMILAGGWKSEMSIFWCRSITHNVKSYKKSMKKLKRSNSLFSQGEVSSAVLKTWKTWETKTWITKNFQMLHAIQGTTMWMLTSWGFQKCGTFWVYNFLKGSY